MSRILLQAAALFLMQPLNASAADLIFSGSLQRVTQESLTVRLMDGSLVDARLPKAGDLAGGKIAAQYKLGDQVQIACTRSLELKKLVFLRVASPTELTDVITSLSWRREENLLKHPDPPARAAHDPAGAAQAEFEHARQVNLARAANMPSFTADEIVKLFTTRRANPAAWEPMDTIESEVVFEGVEPTRRHIRLNGKPWNKPRFPRVNWSVDFGSELKPVFNPECPNTFEFEGRQEVRGRQLLVFRFSSPPDGCFGYWGIDGKRYIAARNGRVFVDEPAGNLIRYEEEASQFPQGFGAVSLREATQWDYVRLGDASYLLPVEYEISGALSSGDRWRVSGEFKNHRHFQASTSLTFHQDP
jgi:hypothetical protein